MWLPIHIQAEISSVATILGGTLRLTPINTPNEAHAIGLHVTGFLGEFRGGGRGKLMTEVTRRITWKWPILGPGCELSNESHGWTVTHSRSLLSYCTGTRKAQRSWGWKATSPWIGGGQTEWFSKTGLNSQRCEAHETPFHVELEESDCCSHCLVRLWFRRWCIFCHRPVLSQWG